MARIAKSLDTLRSQVDKSYPGRDKSNDGWIGDERHQATNSDHNPNAAGVVTALDITNDPRHGLVSRKLAETLVASRDARIKYIISNREIISSKINAWQWRPYSGVNAHEEHVHISVMGDPRLYDDGRAWRLEKQEDAKVGKVTGVTATMFGGSSDPNRSAYDNHFIDDQELGCAYPFRIEGERPTLRLTNRDNGTVVDCPIVDVGPWNTTDDWLRQGRRPRVETQFRNKTVADNGRIPTNDAGIDLTTAAARAIGLPGKGKVDVEIITDQPWQPPQPEPPPPPPPLPSPPDIGGGINWENLFPLLRIAAKVDPQDIETIFRLGFKYWSLILEALSEMNLKGPERRDKMTDDTPTKKMVNVESAIYSKINWTQIVGALVAIAVAVGVPISDDEKVKLMAGIPVLQGFITWIFRTWFTTTITPASVERLNK